MQLLNARQNLMVVKAKDFRGATDPSRKPQREISADAATIRVDGYELLLTPHPGPE
jgi:hypothetical protein